MLLFLALTSALMVLFRPVSSRGGLQDVRTGVSTNIGTYAALENLAGGNTTMEDVTDAPQC
jgi:hypothetical protein